MTWLITKYALTSAVIVLISEIAKRSGKLGALLTALPLITILALIWLYIEGQSTEKIASYAAYTFWYVLPTLPLFLVFPYLLRQLGFWLALVLGMAVAIVCFVFLAWFLKPFRIELWP